MIGERFFIAQKRVKKYGKSLYEGLLPEEKAMTMLDDTEVADGDATAVAEEELAQPEVGQEEAPQDFKALYETEKAEHERTQQRLRSANGQLKGTLDSEALLRANRRETREIKGMLQAVLNGQISGDPAQIKEELDKATREGVVLEAQESFNKKSAAFMVSILEEAEDMGIDARFPNGNPNLKALHAVPELQESLHLFDQGLVAKGAAGIELMEDAFKKAREVRRASQTATYEKNEAEKKKKNGSLNSPIIRASGGGSGSANYIQKLKSGEALPAAEEIDQMTAKYLR